MPVSISKSSSGGYSVSTPNMVHAKSTTLEKAKSQERLLNAIEHNPHFTPYTSDNMIGGGKKRKKAKRSVK